MKPWSIRSFLKASATLAAAASVPAILPSCSKKGVTGYGEAVLPVLDRIVECR